MFLFYSIIFLNVWGKSQPRRSIKMVLIKEKCVLVTVSLKNSLQCHFLVGLTYKSPLKGCNGRVRK